jgi:3-dehydroquinate dehydratase I
VSVLVGEVVLGDGRPKVCVPLTGATVETLREEARAVRPDVADLVELRIDRFGDLGLVSAVERAIDAVRAELDPAVPILITCRSVREGGGADLPAPVLTHLLGTAAAHDGVAAVDVEMEGPVAAVDAVRATGKPVVLSFHDFARTPSGGEIVDRLVRQATMGADVVKLACMPRSPADVLTLLAATTEYAARPDALPAITMAMGPLGVVSRLAGETFGSCLTFGTVGAASAPGQVDAARLRDALDLLHEAQQR